MKKEMHNPDFTMIVSVLGLLTLGIIMVYSSSSVMGEVKGDPFYFIKRQLIFAMLGVALMFINTNIHYGIWKRWSKIGFIVCCLLLILVLIMGQDINGAKRWLGIGDFGIQPSEFVKFSLILVLAKWFSEHHHEVSSIRRGLAPPLFLTGVGFCLVVLQPDLGMATVLLGSAILLIFIAGCRWSHLVGLFMAGIVGVISLTLAAPYRMKRIISFLDPWQDPLNSGYQLVQSLYAIGSGRMTGIGLGMSRQKYFYLPEPYNDFIFAILAEELGFIGVLFILFLFLLFFWRGFRTAIMINDRFGSLLAAGIVSIIAIQVVLNVGIVSGVFPVTGITLPFISYGGSSLTLLLASVGVLLNISRYTELKP